LSRVSDNKIHLGIAIFAMILGVFIIL